jgi:ABC-type molybdate transport system permease subunit
LTGFNQHRVRDKKKLGGIVGAYSFAVAVVLIVSGFIQIIPLPVIMPLVVVGYLLLVVYVNARMVE